MMQVSVPIYQSELSPAKQRGRMVGGHGILIVCGYAMAAWTGLGMYCHSQAIPEPFMPELVLTDNEGCFFAAPAVGWRLCLSLQVISPLLLLIGSPWLPESPRWLIAHNREREGLEVLARLHVTKHDTTDLLAKEEYYQIRKQIELENQTGVTSLLEMFKRKSYRKRMLCGFLVQYITLLSVAPTCVLTVDSRFAAQSTGVLVVNNYQVLLYGNLGLSGWLPLMLYGIYTSWAAFLNWVNSLLL